MQDKARAFSAEQIASGSLIKIGADGVIRFVKYNADKRIFHNKRLIVGNARIRRQCGKTEIVFLSLSDTYSRIAKCRNGCFYQNIGAHVIPVEPCRFTRNCCAVKRLAIYIIGANQIRIARPVPNCCVKHALAVKPCGIEKVKKSGFTPAALGSGKAVAACFIGVKPDAAAFGAGSKRS